MLAAECLRDVGPSRVQGTLEQDVQRRLRKDLEAPLPLPGRWSRRKPDVQGWLDQRAQAMEALVRAGSGYWTAPHGEPEWIQIPAGEFWMGEGDAAFRLSLDTFSISPVPITNAQYHLFTQATGRCERRALGRGPPAQRPGESSCRQRDLARRPGLLRLAAGGDRQARDLAERGRVGEGGARRQGPACLSVGRHLRGDTMQQWGAGC